MTSLTPKTIIRAQDRLLKLLGNTPEGRSPLVAEMLKRDANETTAYWPASCQSLPSTFERNCAHIIVGVPR